MEVDREYDAAVKQLAADLDRLLRRLRSLTRHSWQGRRNSVVALVDRLVELSARAEQRTVQPVPTLPDHSLPDAVSVISGDLLDALASRQNPKLLRAAQVAVCETWESTT